MLIATWAHLIRGPDSELVQEAGAKPTPFSSLLSNGCDGERMLPVCSACVGWLLCRYRTGPGY